MKVLNKFLPSLVDRPSAVRSQIPTRVEKPEQEEQQVKLSSEGLAKANDDMAARSVHARTYQAPSLSNRQSYKYTELGKDAFSRLQPPQHYSDEEAERFKGALAYVTKRFDAGGHWAPPYDSPFWGLGRDELVAIEQDEQNYTEVERLAAQRVKNELDDNYFAPLFAHVQRNGDTRPLLKGYYEYLQHLSPAERLNYPDGEEARVTAELALREREFGPLPEGFTIWDFVDWYSPDNRDLLARLGVRDDGEHTTAAPMEDDA